MLFSLKEMVNDFETGLEQNRIVTKVDELMALCEQLETQLATAANLLSALLAQLTGTPSNNKVLPRPRPAPVVGVDHANLKSGHLPCHSMK